jgi:hypothetical protein
MLVGGNAIGKDDTQELEQNIINPVADSRSFNIIFVLESKDRSCDLSLFS